MEWKDLNILDKSKWILFFVSQGIIDKSLMQELYDLCINTNPKTTYTSWLGAMHNKYPWLELDSEKAGYDYERYFNENYDDAISRLNELEPRHFTDRYKLPNHPTFSEESIYSQGPRYGGRWIGDNEFIPSVINQLQYPDIYLEYRPYSEDEIYKAGGSIHIKPENRGKFTALKKRTGHSASWFKAHGTPALKKMATFALNARLWHKNDDGGHLFQGDTSSNVNVLKVNDEGLPEYTLPEVIVSYSLPKRNEDKSRFDRYVQSIANSYINGNINTNDVNRLPWLYRNSVLGSIGNYQPPKYTSDLLKRQEWYNINNFYKYNSRKAFTETGRELSEIEDRLYHHTYDNTDEYVQDLEKYEKISRRKYDYEQNEIHKQDYLSNHLGRVLNSYIPFVDLFDEGPNSLPSQLYRYALRHNIIKTPQKARSTIGGSGTDIVSLNDNVIRLTPESKLSTGLFNEFVETANPSIRTAGEYKSGNIRNFSDRNIPTKNVYLYQGVEDGKFKIGNINTFKDDTKVYPVRNIKLEFLAPINKISILRNGDESLIFPDYIYSINKYIPHGFYNEKYTEHDKLNKQKRDLENDYAILFDTEGIRYALLNFSDEELSAIGFTGKEIEDNFDITRNNLDSIINLSDDELRRINPFPSLSVWQKHNPIKTDSEKELKKSYDKYNDIEKRFYDLGFEAPGMVAISNKIDSLINSDKYKQEEILRDYYLDLAVLERKDFYNARDNFIQKHPGIDKENGNEIAYIVTDTTGRQYPVSELNASILDNKMVLGNPNGGIFIGRFLDISQPLLDSLNAYLQKNPSWISRNDLGSFDLYRLDSPSLGEYLKQYYEHPDPNDPNVYVVGTTKPNKLWNTKQNGGHLFQGLENSKLIFQNGTPYLYNDKGVFLPEVTINDFSVLNPEYIDNPIVQDQTVSNLNEELNRPLYFTRESALASNKDNAVLNKAEDTNAFLRTVRLIRNSKNPMWFGAYFTPLAKPLLMANAIERIQSGKPLEAALYAGLRFAPEIADFAEKNINTLKFNLDPFNYNQGVKLLYSWQHPIITRNIGEYSVAQYVDGTMYNIKPIFNTEGKQTEWTSTNGQSIIQAPKTNKINSDILFKDNFFDLKPYTPEWEESGIGRYVDKKGLINRYEFENLFPLIEKENPLIYKNPRTIFNNNLGRSQDLLLHSYNVARTASDLPLPKGTTRLELVFSALMHDIGRAINASDKTHGHSSARLVNQLIFNRGIRPDDPQYIGADTYLNTNIPQTSLNARVFNSIYRHMDTDAFGDQSPESGLLQALRLSDVARGLNYDLAAAKYPHLLVYDRDLPVRKSSSSMSFRDDLKYKVNPVLKQLKMPTIDLNASREEQWKQLEDVISQYRTFLRGARDPYKSVNQSAEDARNSLNAQRGSMSAYGEITPLSRTKYSAEYIPYDPTGSGRAGIFNLGYDKNGLPYHKLDVGAKMLGLDPEVYDVDYLSTSDEIARHYALSTNNRYGNAYKVELPFERHNDNEMPSDFLLRSDFDMYNIDAMKRGYPLGTRSMYEIPYRLLTGRSLLLDIKNSNPDAVPRPKIKDLINKPNAFTKEELSLYDKVKSAGWYGQDAFDAHYEDLYWNSLNTNQKNELENRMELKRVYENSIDNIDKINQSLEKQGIKFRVNTGKSGLLNPNNINQLHSSIESINKINEIIDDTSLSDRVHYNTLLLELKDLKLKGVINDQTYKAIIKPTEQMINESDLVFFDNDLMNAASQEAFKHIRKAALKYFHSKACMNRAVDQYIDNAKLKKYDWKPMLEYLKNPDRQLAFMREQGVLPRFELPLFNTLIVLANSAPLSPKYLQRNIIHAAVVGKKGEKALDVKNILDYRDLRNTSYGRDSGLVFPGLSNKSFANGGQIIWDQNGQLNHPGAITGIKGNRNGTNITMNNVNDDVIGIDSFGNTLYMTEGNNYYFPGEYVVEYPVNTYSRQYGGVIENTQNFIAPYLQDLVSRHSDNFTYLPQYMQDYVLKDVAYVNLNQYERPNQLLVNLVTPLQSKLKRSLSDYVDKNKLDYMQTVWDYLDKYNMSPYNRAALMGNIMLESSFNPKAKNPKSSAYGLFLMLDTPRNKAYAWMNQNKITDKDLGLIDWYVHLMNDNIDEYMDEYNNFMSRWDKVKQQYELNPSSTNKKYMDLYQSYYDTTYKNRVDNNEMWSVLDLNNTWNNTNSSLADRTIMFERVFEKAGSGAEHLKRINAANDILDYFFPDHIAVDAMKKDPLNYINGEFQYDEFGEPIKKQYGGLIKPFSYNRIPLVRY